MGLGGVWINLSLCRGGAWGADGRRACAGVGRTAGQRAPGVQAPSRPSLSREPHGPSHRTLPAKNALRFPKTPDGNLLCWEEWFWVRTEIYKKARNEMSRWLAIL